MSLDCQWCFFRANKPLMMEILIKSFCLTTKCTFMQNTVLKDCNRCHKWHKLKICCCQLGIVYASEHLLLIIKLNQIFVSSSLSKEAVSARTLQKSSSVNFFHQEVKSAHTKHTDDIKLEWFAIRVKERTNNPVSPMKKMCKDKCKGLIY